MIPTHHGVDLQLLLLEEELRSFRGKSGSRLGQDWVKRQSSSKQDERDFEFTKKSDQVVDQLAKLQILIPGSRPGGQQRCLVGVTSRNNITGSALNTFSNL